jgi:hypothetical protein
MNTTSGRSEDAPLLHGLRIGLSGAVPERETWGEIADLDRLILRFIAQFAGMAFKYGAQIVHGSHPSFTPVLIATAKQFCGEEGDKRLTLIRADVFDEPTRYTRQRMTTYANTTTVSTLQGIPDVASTGREASLTAMRIVLISQIDVLVAIGGKVHPQTGQPSGVLDEMSLARLSGVPCFPIASLGGTQQASPEVLQTFAQDNMLSAAEFQQLALRSEEIDLAAGRLIAHLIKYRDHWIGRQLKGAGSFYRLDKGAAEPEWSKVPHVEVPTEAVAHALGELNSLRSAVKSGSANLVSTLLNARSELGDIVSSVASEMNDRFFER